MRLAQVNRIQLVAISSAVVSALLGSYGCKMQPKPAAVHQPTMAQNSIMVPSTDPTTGPSTQVSTDLITGPSNGLIILPASQPTSEPSSQPVTQATSQPAEGPIHNAELPTDFNVIYADKALAEQFAGVAELQFNQKVPDRDEWPWIWKHQGYVLSASAELNTEEGRFPRLMADAMAQVRDKEAHEAEQLALRKAIAANALDEFSWNRQMDLYLNDMDDLGARVKYLQQVIASTAGQFMVPANVRAHAGYRLALTLLDRGEDDAATTALEDAVKTCPSSVECLSLQLRLLPPSSGTEDRCRALLALLKANPLQGNISGQLADMIADAGLARESLPFYRLNVSTLHQQGNPALHAMLNWAAATFIADPKTSDAFNVNSIVLRIAPNFSSAYFLQLVITRYSGDKDAYTKALTQGGNVMGNHIIDLMNKVAPADAVKATTRPVDDPDALVVPDMAATIAQLKATGTPEQQDEFAEAISDLAMLQGYFAQQPDASAKLIDALGTLLPETDPRLVRLRGWNDFLSGKPEDARAKFLAVSAKEPLAELGLIRVMMTNPVDQPTAANMARRLLQDHPSGLLGALLLEQSHNDRVRMVATSQAVELRKMVSEFPPILLKGADNPRLLYDVRITPTNVGTLCGDPLLASIVIENLSDYDLTIGPDGLLKSELMFKVTPDLEKLPTFDAFDTVAGQTSLPKHEVIKQVVRVDQTQFLTFLNAQSLKVFGINGTVSTNRTMNGAGGFVVPFTKPYWRKPSQLNGINEREAMENLVNGRPDQKITALNQMTVFVGQLRSAPAVNGQSAPQPKDFLEAIHKTRGDSLPAISAWAGWCEFIVTQNAGDQITIVNELAQDPDWRHRQVALLLVDQIPPTDRDAVLSLLINDTQYSVHRDARALQGRFAIVPAEGATTMPTTAPTTAPTTMATSEPVLAPTTAP